MKALKIFQTALFIVMYLLVAALAIAVFFPTQYFPVSQAIKLLVPFSIMMLIVLFLNILQALISGTIRYRGINAKGQDYSRQNQPISYWSVIVLNISIALVLFFFILVFIKILLPRL